MVATRVLDSRQIESEIQNGNISPVFQTGTRAAPSNLGVHRGTEGHLGSGTLRRRFRQNRLHQGMDRLLKSEKSTQVQVDATSSLWRVPGVKGLSAAIIYRRIHDETANPTRLQ